jgi:hypothetical protein
MFGKCQPPFEFRPCFSEAPGMQQSDGAVHPDARILWRESDRSIVGIEGRVETSLYLQHDAEIAPAARLLGCLRHHLAELPNCGAKLA